MISGSDFSEITEYEYCGQLADPGGYGTAAFHETAAQMAILRPLGDCGCSADMPVSYRKFPQPDTQPSNSYAL